jgi:hypothetical protein
MKAYWEWRYSSTHSLTSALDGGEWSASRPGHFIPMESATRTHLIGGWVGPRAVLDTVMKRKIPSPRRESNPRTPIVQPVAQRYTDWAITTLQYQPVIMSVTRRVWNCLKNKWNALTNHRISKLHKLIYETEINMKSDMCWVRVWGV